jgi:hypothetical protein
MGKSEEKKAQKRAHKAADGVSKHKKQPRSPFETNFEAIDDGGVYHSQWRDLFRKLCEFKVQFGHCLVPTRYSANPQLGVWVSSQRARFRNNTEEKSTSRTAEHIRALDGIGFDWGTRKTDWSVRFQQLCKFKVKFGHCLVPTKYATDPKLGNWVSNQRCYYRLYQEGKPNPMTADRIRELDGINFDWRWTNMTDWMVRFEQMREFKVQFGHCLVPSKYSANPKLGRWVKNQRTSYRLYQEGKPNPMTADRIRELDGINFDSGTSQTDWSVRFQQLCEFKEQFGHCLVPTKYSTDPKLGNWVSNQRSYYRLYQEGKPSPMTADRSRALDGIGFVSGRKAKSHDSGAHLRA